MPNKAILFVDDELSILQIRRLMFEALGYSVFTLESGEQALQVLAEIPIDAVILDYLMPGMNGEETARAIRKSLPDIPMILSSGCLEIPTSTIALVNLVINKAENPGRLIEAVLQCVAHRIGSPGNEIGMSTD
jgi:CheY-like chemotaxis protein